MKNIHQTAVIEDGAIIGDDANIEAYAFVSKDAVLGNNVTIKQGARVLGKTRIGDNSRVFSYAIVGDIPTIREFCTINSGTHKGDGITRIGDNAFIMAYSHIAHDCIIGSNVILANNATLAGHVELGDYAVVGGLTPIHQFVRVGESCMVAGASALSQDVVPFCLAEGNRAYIRSLNLVGIRRRFDKEQVEELVRAYKFLFNQGISLKDQANELIAKTSDENVKKMCKFILETTRGIPLAKGRD